ncbi:hypothetical protein G8764_18865 [Pseudomaricurvus alcaniphilus]|uniref:protein YgfX n=1 Tax=Pseudomaricurvus alcaniphilus TaxID=1166482 RepID=UPI001409815A|nr:protein YgfX [Pseudomaricurvus alcaniphilus]NHN39372.1 hypothetical protein [Pseudomaricurvus alcaniphilus]
MSAPGRLHIVLQPSRLALWCSACVFVLLLVAISFAHRLLGVGLGLAVVGVAVLLLALAIRQERRVAGLSLTCEQGRFSLAAAGDRPVPVRLVSRWYLAPWLLQLGFKAESVGSGWVTGSSGRLTLRIWRDSCEPEQQRILRTIVCNRR